MAKKSRPSQVPDDGPSLTESLDLALEDPEVARDMRITLQISGGLAKQSYSLDFDASGGGGIRCSVNCELSRRKRRRERKRVDRKAFLSLLRRIRSSGVLRIAQEGPPFLPDTVVGCLQITDGRSVQKHYFAADPDQAAVQKRKPPARLMRAVDAIYAEGAKVIGMRSVKP